MTDTFTLNKAVDEYIAFFEEELEECEFELFCENQGVDITGAAQDLEGAILWS